MLIIPALGRQTGESEVQSHSQLHRKFEASLGYMTPCLLSICIYAHMHYMHIINTLILEKMKIKVTMRFYYEPIKMAKIIFKKLSVLYQVRNKSHHNSR